MCDPMTAIAGASLALGLFGTISNSQQQQSYQQAPVIQKNAAVGQAVQKSTALQDASTQVFVNDALKPIADSTPTARVLPAQVDNTAVLQGNAPPVQNLAGLPSGTFGNSANLAGGAITANAPSIIQDDAKTSLLTRLGKQAESNAALGNLSGYETSNSNTARNLVDTGNKVGTFSNFASENAGVDAANINAAAGNANAGRTPSPFGDILTGVGQIGAYGAGKGWFAPTDPLAPVKVTPINKAFA
jgi:hypothetical protein